jgi:prolyl-tRNA synthetase
VHSYRDLPLLINQWANVVRWELRPRLFLRTTEFLWQEGHTAHATYEEARDFAARVQSEVYGDFLRDVLAMDFVSGRKTARERFAGAINTLTLESMMGDGKALQMVTSHELGQNFAKAFHTRYVTKDGRQEHVWQTSWGSTTRMIGALVMAHGDDDGLRVPPRLAPVQAVVLAVRGDEGVLSAVRALGGRLAEAGVRVHVDDRTDVPFGRRAVDWELKGVPVRIEVGPRDLENGTAMLVRRIPGTKEPVAAAALPALLPGALADDQALLLAQSRRRRVDRTVEVTGVAEAVEAARTGWARIPWATLGPDGEARLAEQGVSVRCLVAADGSVPASEDEPGTVAVVGRAY